MVVRSKKGKKKKEQQQQQKQKANWCKMKKKLAANIIRHG